MKKLIVAFQCFLLMACVNKVKPAEPSDKHEFFPVTSFLQGQVHEVDSLKLPTYKYTTQDNRTDTMLISLDEFDSLAREFMAPDINDPAIRKFYKETSFADQSIPNVTFTYSTNDAGLPLRRMDVIVNPDPVLNDQVTSIYLEKVIRNGDTTSVKKLYWKTNRYFQIISSVEPRGQATIFSQIKVAWTATD